MGIWPFGREKADVDTASRVVVLRARDAVPMRAKVTLKFVAPQTQTVADQTAEISSDLLRGVVREAPTALSVLGYEVVISAEVIARLPHEAAALRSMEIAGLHIVGDPGHMARPAAPSDVPDWLRSLPQPSSSVASDVHPIDRSMDRPTPIQPVPGREVGIPARGSVINPTPAHPMPVVKRVATVADRLTPAPPMPSSKPATSQVSPPSSTQQAPPSTQQAPPSTQQAPPSATSAQQAPPVTPQPHAVSERTVRSAMNALPGAPGAKSGERSSELPSAPTLGGGHDALAANALSSTPSVHVAPAAQVRPAVLPPPPPERPTPAPPEVVPPSSSAEPSRAPLSTSPHRPSSSASFAAVQRGEDAASGPRSTGQRPSASELTGGPPSSISGGRYTTRPPPAAVAARRRVIASRLALPAGAGPYEVARGLTPLFRDTAGRILVAFLRAYDLTVVRRVPFDAVEGDILSSLTAPSDGAPGTYTATHSSEINRWREAFGAAKMEQLQREANLAAAAIGYELLAAEGVPQRTTSAIVEGLAGSAFGDPDLVTDIGRYLFPVNGTTSAEVTASMIAIAREDAPPGLETALEPLFAALREDIAAAALIAKEVMGMV